MAPVKQIYEVGQAWPFPCMVVITSGETLAKRKDDVWKALDAQNQAIDLLQKQPAQASADRVLLHRRADAQDPDARRAAARDGDRRGHQHPGVHAKLTDKDTRRMQEIADILQAQGSLKTRDGKPYDVSSIVDLSWQEAPSFERFHSVTGARKHLAGALGVVFILRCGRPRRWPCLTS